MNDPSELERALTWMTSHSVVVRTSRIDGQDHVRVAMDVDADTLVVVKHVRRPAQGPLDHLLDAVTEARDEAESIRRRRRLTLIPGEAG